MIPIEFHPIIDRKYAYLTLRYRYSVQVKGYFQIFYEGRNQLLHRVIMGLELGRTLSRKEEVDHRNFIKADVRVENLCITTRKGNVEHQKENKFRGTHFNGYGWVAQVGHNKMKFNLGTFQSRETAAKVAKAKRKELNFLS